MKKKITRPVSILLTLLLLIGTFTALPFTITAAAAETTTIYFIDTEGFINGGNGIFINYMPNGSNEYQQMQMPYHEDDDKGNRVFAANVPSGNIKEIYFENTRKNTEGNGEYKKTVVLSENINNNSWFAPLSQTNPNNEYYVKRYSGQPYYNLWLGSTRVTDDNLDDICGDGQGRAKYNPSTKTLTLNNPNIAGFANPFIYEEKVKIVSKDDLTIKGQYSQPDSDLPYIGIYCYKSLTLRGDLVFRGKGTGIMAFEGINFASGEIGIYSGTPDFPGSYAVDNQGENSAITFGSQLVKLTAETSKEDGTAIFTRGTFEFGDDIEITEPAGAGIYQYENMQGEKYGQRIAISEDADSPSRVVIEPTYDNLWVGGIQVTEINKDDILGDGQGKAKYDPSTKTLTLNNVLLGDNHNGWKIYSSDDLTLKGKYTMAGSSATGGIKVDGNLTLDGDFDFLGNDTGIYAGNITVASGSVYAYGSWSYGVRCQNLNIKNGITKFQANIGNSGEKAIRSSSITLGSSIVLGQPVNGKIVSGDVYESNGTTLARNVVFEPKGYDLWVGSTKVTESNKNDILGDGSGRIRFDPATNTLKLMNNPTINGTFKYPNTPGTNLIYWDSEDTLRIEGSLYMNSAVSDYGITAARGSLDLAGNFTIRASSAPIYARGDITFSSGTIKAISDGYCGIDSFAGNIEVKNDVVKLYAKGNDDAVSFGNCTLGNKMQITTPEGGYIGNGNILQSNGNRAKEVVIEPEFETLGVTSVIVAGSGNGSFLNGADWDPCDTSNSMSQVAVNVWEKTYTGVSASDAYWIKFAVNSVDEDGEASQDPWKYTFGSLSEAVYQTSVMYNAVFGGEKDGFKVPYDNATVRIRLDLSEFNMNTKEGAKLLVFVNETEKITVYFTDTLNWGIPYINYGREGTNLAQQSRMSYDSEKSTEAGLPVYAAEIPINHKSIWFSNGDFTKTTVNTFDNIADGAWWYALPETNYQGFNYLALVGSEIEAEYTIAGSSTAIFGTQWDINNPLNDMIYDADNNCYFLKYSNVEPEFDVQLKVVKNHDWSNNWPEENYTFDVISKTNVIIKFYPDTGEIKVTGKGVSQITELDVKSVIVAGNGEDDYLNGANWDPTDTRNQMTEIADGIWEYTTARLPEFDNYQFKFAINSIGEDGSPTTNPWAYNFGFDEEKVYDPFIIHNAKFNGANGIFEVDEEGSTVTLQLDLRNFDYTTKKGAKIRFDINRPEKYDVKLGNVEVTELNKDNILGDGKASYNPNTKTLYLMDPAIDVSGGDCNAITVFNDDIKIVGSYHMTEAAGLYGVEIEGKAGSLTLLGNFTFLGTDGGIRVAQDVNIDGGKLVVRAADGTGIFSDFGSINVGADVESVDVEGTDYAMLTVWSDSNININSDLTITTPEGGTVGNFDEDDCTVFDGATPATHVVIAGEVEDTAITEISITNVTLPVGGQIPTNTAVGETGYDINMVNWYDAETDELVTGEFEADHQYYVKIVLWAQEGYVFDDPLAKINGEYAGVFALDDMDEEKYIYVSQFYIAQSSGTVDPDTEITSVALTNVTVPKSGETWDFTATVPESCELLEAVLFDSEGTQINNYDFVPLTAQTYTAEFVLLAQDGYVFGYEDGTMPKFIATVNGEKATALVAFEEFPDDKMCRVRWSFTVEEGGGDEPGALVDPDTGISVTTDEDVELIVVDITGTDIAGDIVIQGENVDKVYNITLFKDGQEVQPGSKVTVKIPCDNPDAKVYRVEADGSLTDMNAVYQDGYLVFETEHFSEYIVASPAPAPARKIGDVNGDNNVDVLDAAIVQKYAAGKTTLTPEQIYAGDVNGDNNADVLDAAMIQKYAAGKVTEFPKKA